ncbi:MAG TPA: methyltransferase domain-containing protein [Thermoanaerobaculia bacterium]|nr:methyltransferase domain-containing protein [Thermoanaerobaculia bacterium]
MLLICPACRAPLADDAGALRCLSCRARYPVDGGIADFSGGHYYDHFTGPDSLGEEHRIGLAAEVEGSRWRIERFYAPRLGAGARVLDAGCGNGVSVDVLHERGFDAWGIDLSSLRKWQWRERTQRDRLAVASALRLPFPDASFDAVLSSGVIEHIGVEELGGATYSVRPLPERDALRDAFAAELLRVTRPGGRVFIDCPNGAFPIDFWHGAVAGRARWHSPREGFLPSFDDVRRHVHRADPGAVVRRLPARDRFAFRQVGRHWYGRMFRAPMAWWLRFGRGTPYLVVEVTRPV